MGDPPSGLIPPLLLPLLAPPLLVLRPGLLVLKPVLLVLRPVLLVTRVVLLRLDKLRLVPARLRWGVQRAEGLGPRPQGVGEGRGILRARTYSRNCPV